MPQRRAFRILLLHLPRCVPSFQHVPLPLLVADGTTLSAFSTAAKYSALGLCSSTTPEAGTSARCRDPATRRRVELPTSWVSQAG